MTNELEKQFFDTFGIEPKSLFICKRGYYPEVCTQPTCKGCNEAMEHGKYPQITDRILLELICVITEWDNVELFAIKGVENLKENILNQAVNIITNKEVYCDDFDEQIIHQVRTLFEEGGR